MMVTDYKILSFGPKNEKYIRFYHGDCREGMSTHLHEGLSEMAKKTTHDFSYFEYFEYLLVYYIQ